MLARGGEVAIDVVLHPNPQVSQAMFHLLGEEPRIRLVAPLGHGAMIDAMRRADLILSDSGGVQEEAPALGVPLLVLRDSTERPEGISAGNALLVGTDTRRVVEAAAGLLTDRAALAAMATPRLPFGDGQAAPRIVALALDWLDVQADEPSAARSAGRDRTLLSSTRLKRIDSARPSQHRARAPRAPSDGPFV